MTRSPSVDLLVDEAGALCRVVVNAAIDRGDLPSDEEVALINRTREAISAVLDESGGFLRMTVRPL